MFTSKNSWARGPRQPPALPAGGVFRMHSGLGQGSVVDSLSTSMRPWFKSYWKKHLDQIYISEFWSWHPRGDVRPAPLSRGEHGQVQVPTPLSSLPPQHQRSTPALICTPTACQPAQNKLKIEAFVLQLFTLESRQLHEQRSQAENSILANEHGKKYYSKEDYQDSY